jgi:phage gp36-like protein
VTYCAVADVQAILNPLGGVPAPASAAALPPTILLTEIGRAEDFVNGWLADRYSVPFDGNGGPVPDLVARVTADVAAFYATTDAAGNQDIGPNHPSAIRYSAAVATCRALARGNMTLALPATDSENANVTTGPINGVVFNQASAPCFSPSDYSLGAVPCGGGPGTWDTGGWQGMPF